MNFSSSKSRNDSFTNDPVLKLTKFQQLLNLLSPFLKQSYHAEDFMT